MLYCWFCGQSGLVKKNYPFKQKQAHTPNHPKRKPVVLADNSMKQTNKHLWKQLNFSHCGRNNHAVENYFTRYIFEYILLLGDSQDRVLKGDIMFFNTLQIPFLWKPRPLVLISTSLDGFGSTSHHYPFQLQHFLQCLHLLIRRKMMYWIQIKSLCRLFTMI